MIKKLGFLYKIYQNEQNTQRNKGRINFPLKIIIQILFTVAMPTDPITITHISLNKNSTPFLNTIDFTFTFEAHHALTAPLEWKITYVGSAKDESYDQILEEFEINSIELGSTMKFTVECSPPNCEKIPRKELLSLTAIIITVAYKQQQFLRIGYYVHIMTAKDLSEEEKMSTPAKQLVKYLTRTILIDKPRITKFKIDLATLEKESSAKMDRIQSTPIKSDKGEHSNSQLSLSKTSCNEKQSSLGDLTPVSKLALKKEKKIRKLASKPPL